MTRVNLGLDTATPNIYAGNRRVAHLSDGYIAVCLVKRDSNFRIFVGTPDRSSFTLAIEVAFHTGDYLTMEVGPDDRLHISVNALNGDVMYLRYDRTDTTEYTMVGSPITVVERDTTFFVGRRDIALLPNGGTVIMALTYIFGPSHHTAVRIYYRSPSGTTFSEKWVSGTESITGMNIEGACSIAVDKTGLEPDGVSVYFVMLYQLMQTKRGYVRSFKMDQTTGAISSNNQLTAFDPPSTGSSVARMISGLVFSQAENKWLIMGTLGHATGSQYTRPFAMQCTRTAITKRVDASGGPDGIDTYNPGTGNRDGTFPSFAYIVTPEGYACGVSITAYTLSNDMNRNAVTTRVCPLDEDGKPTAFGPYTRLIEGGYSHFSAGAHIKDGFPNPRGLDGIYVRRDTRYHYFFYNTRPATPTGVTPSPGSTVATGKPRVAATLATLAGGLQVGRVRGSWTLASDAGFTTDVKTVEESALGAAGLHSTTLTETLDSGTWYIKGRTLSEFGTYGPYSTPQSFVISHPPSLSQLQPTGYRKNEAITFSGKFSDPFPGDTQSAIQVQVVTSGDSPATVFDSGKVAGTSAVNDDWTGYLNQDLEWRARAWDADDTVGAWSNYVPLLVDDPPAVDVTSWQTTTPTPTIEWSYSGNRAQKRWRVEVRRSTNGQLLASGSGVGEDTSWTVPDPALIPNMTGAHIVVTAWDTGELDGSDTQAVYFSWIPPDGPALYVIPDGFEETGEVTVTWADAVREEAFVCWRVYRRLAGTASWVLLHQTDSDTPDEEGNYYFQDFFAPQNVDSEWAVVQVALRYGAEVESVRVAIREQPVGTNYWLIHPTDADFRFKVYNVTSDSFTDARERQELVVIGRGRHVEEGTVLGRSGTATGKLWDWDDTLSPHARRMQFEAMKRLGGWVWFRTPFGDVWKVSVGDIQWTRTAGTGTDEVLEVSIPYSEVV